MDNLALLKSNLGIMNTARDDYLTQILLSAKSEIEVKGITLTENVEDTMLLCDYAAWRFRGRGEDTPIPQNIMIRIRERQIKERSNYVG